MRSILAAIDWNENSDRAYKISDNGEPIYKRKVNCCQFFSWHSNNLQIDRAGKKLTVVAVKEAKDLSYQDEIVETCIKFMDEDIIPDVDVSWKENVNVLDDIFQYPIDEELLEQLDEERKSKFSKVDGSSL